MSLHDRLTEDLKLAMKARDQLRMDVIRMIKAAVMNKEMEIKKDLDDAEMSRVMTTMIKQRKESISHFEKGGRLELAQQEQEEIAVIEGFLPKQMGDADAAKAVADLIAELGAASIKDMGRTMAALRERYAGQMDFGRASQIVKSKLG